MHRRLSTPGGGGGYRENPHDSAMIGSERETSKSTNMTFSMLSPFSLLAVELFLVHLGGVEFVDAPIYYYIYITRAIYITRVRLLMPDNGQRKRRMTSYLTRRHYSCAEQENF